MVRSVAVADDEKSEGLLYKKLILDKIVDYQNFQLKLLML